MLNTNTNTTTTATTTTEAARTVRDILNEIKEKHDDNAEAVRVVYTALKNAVTRRLAEQATKVFGDHELIQALASADITAHTLENIPARVKCEKGITRELNRAIIRDLYYDGTITVWLDLDSDTIRHGNRGDMPANAVEVADLTKYYFPTLQASCQRITCDMLKRAAVSGLLRDAAELGTDADAVTVAALIIVESFGNWQNLATNLTADAFAQVTGYDAEELAYEAMDDYDDTTSDDTSKNDAGYPANVVAAARAYSTDRYNQGAFLAGWRDTTKAIEEGGHDAGVAAMYDASYHFWQFGADASSAAVAGAKYALRDHTDDDPDDPNGHDNTSEASEADDNTSEAPAIGLTIAEKEQARQICATNIARELRNMREQLPGALASLVDEAYKDGRAYKSGETWTGNLAVVRLDVDTSGRREYLDRVALHIRRNPADGAKVAAYPPNAPAEGCTMWADIDPETAEALRRIFWPEDYDHTSDEYDNTSDDMPTALHAMDDDQAATPQADAPGNADQAADQAQNDPNDGHDMASSDKIINADAQGARTETAETAGKDVDIMTTTAMTSKNTTTQTTAERIRHLCASIEAQASHNPSAWREICEAEGMDIDLDEEASARWAAAHPDIDPASEEGQNLAMSEDMYAYYPDDAELDDMYVARVIPIDLAYQMTPSYTNDAEILEALESIAADLADKAAEGGHDAHHSDDNASEADDTTTEKTTAADANKDIAYVDDRKKHNHMYREKFAAPAETAYDYHLDALIMRNDIAISGIDPSKILVRLPCKNAADEIRAHNDAILARLNAHREAQRAAFDQREAKKHALPGLDEIRDAIDKYIDWHYRFARSFDDPYGYGGEGCGPCPDYDFEAALEKYPDAAMYLECDYVLSQLWTSEEDRVQLENIQDLILDGAPYQDAVDEWARTYIPSYLTACGVALKHAALKPEVWHLLDA